MPPARPDSPSRRKPALPAGLSLRTRRGLRTETLRTPAPGALRYRPRPLAARTRPAPGLEAAPGPPPAAPALLALGKGRRGNEDAYCCKAVKCTRSAGLLAALRAPRARWLRARLRAPSAPGLNRSVGFQAALSGRVGWSRRHWEEERGKRDFLFYLKKKTNNKSRIDLSHTQWTHRTKPLGISSERSWQLGGRDIHGAERRTRLWGWIDFLSSSPSTSFDCAAVLRSTKGGCPPGPPAWSLALAVTLSSATVQTHLHRPALAPWLCGQKKGVDSK